MRLHPGLVVLALAFFAVWTCGTCARSVSRSTMSEQARVVASEEAAKGLDLEALVGLVKEVKDAEGLEKALNRPNGLNNLDLNGDDQVDYLNVTEYGDQSKEAFGFSITTEVEEGEVQEVASIEMQRNGRQVDVQVSGNGQIYGDNAHYRSFYPSSSFLLWAYLLSPHRMYVSPWGYGSYPPYHSPYYRSGYGDYRGRTEGYRRNSGAQRMSRSGGSSIQNPNKGRSANSGIRRTLRQPTTSQKQFQVRSQGKAVRSGGFGRRSSPATTTGSRQRSARNFGSSPRSYGGFGK